MNFFEFVINSHHYTSPNQRKDPPTLSISESKSPPEPVSPTQLRNHVWALQSYPFLLFILNSPFHGAMTSRFATPPDIEVSRQGYHISTEVAKSWKSLEQSCHQAAAVLHSTFEQDHPKVSLSCITPAKPSEFGYFTAHSSKEKACSAMSQSLDAFVVLFAHLSSLQLVGLWVTPLLVLLQC